MGDCSVGNNPERHMERAESESWSQAKGLVEKLLAKPHWPQSDPPRDPQVYDRANEGPSFE